MEIGKQFLLEENHNSYDLRNTEEEEGIRMRKNRNAATDIHIRRPRKERRLASCP